LKVALICDTHFGVRNDSRRFLDYFTRFYREVFFPYLEEHDINQVVHLGDLVDRRKFINYNTARVMREEFLERLPYTMIMCGNHDVTYRDTNQLNALRELIEDPDIVVFQDPDEWQIDGVPVLVLPWINRENGEEAYRLIRESKADVVFGHLELKGFEHDRGSVMEHGMDPGLFSRFDQVFSGHYHHKSSIKNVHYLGAPYEITWMDHDDPRGFHVWDTETRELEFVQNPLTMHQKLKYSDDLPLVDPEEMRDKIVKLIVKSREDSLRLDKHVRDLEGVGCEVQVVDAHLNMDVLDELAEVEGVGDTLDVLNRYVEGLPDDVDKGALGGLLREVYKEAVDRQC
jgi:predicted phosphodiesterase